MRRGTRWIRRHCRISKEIARHEGKEHNAVATLVLTAAVVAVLEVLAVEEAFEVVVVSGVVVAVAKESVG